MPHDVFGLGTAIGLLMQQLDAWHLLPAFGDFDAIPDQHQPAVESHRIREQPPQCTAMDGSGLSSALSRRAPNRASLCQSGYLPSTFLLL
jgi:hypothetical protein